MNKHDTSRKALGKGLGALLPSRTTPVAEAPPPHLERSLDVAIGLIDPNPLQPRRVFEQERLEELAQSIRANGIVQPLVVRRVGSKLELVAGERRLRANQPFDRRPCLGAVQTQFGGGGVIGFCCCGCR